MNSCSLAKHQKKTSLIFIIIFYLNIVTPNILAAKNSHGFYCKDFTYQFNNHSSNAKKNDALQESKYLLDIDLKNKGRIINQLNKNYSKIFIGGPEQPEMKSFHSVNVNNMVDLFTGDFSYNIPLLDVGGYPVNLHYSSGITMDQEASWVGLGWNINPGTISRNMRGLPDDFDGTHDLIKKTQHVKENKTTGVTLDGSLEVFGGPINVSAKLGLFYNTYNGYGMETGVGIGGTAKTSFGSLTGNLSISNNSQTGLNINPSLSVGIGKLEQENNLLGTLGLSTSYYSRGGISSLQLHGGISNNSIEYRKINQYIGANNNFPLVTISFAVPSYTPTISMPLTNSAYSFTGKIGGELFGTNTAISFTGYVNKQEISNSDTMQVLPAIGYLYSTNGNNRENVLLDFNREKEIAFNFKTTPHIALPQYTYDSYTISGEGTGGSFRPYRGDVGYVFDHSISTRSNTLNGSIDVGTGSLAHFGLEITNITTSNENHRWNHSNAIAPYLEFQNADTTYEPVYFRNPGEKTINAQSFYQSIGDDSLIRIKLSGDHDNINATNSLIKYADGKSQSEILVTAPIVKKERDKRTQVISWLSAKDASVLGLDKNIQSYKENVIPTGNCQDKIDVLNRTDAIHQPNHLSEITVLNSDGRRYIYGLPIYNEEQKDVTFSVDKETNQANIDNGLVQYTPGFDNTTKNNKGKDSYYTKEELPAYAHSFLLTGILSSDYNDITGNGISEDDPGDAIKFNYTQIYGKNNGYYGWRAPFQAGKANYNEGLKSYSRDDKGTYLYGRKELWYLNSIESKTMIAVFTLANDRKDAYSSADENGTPDLTKRPRRLEKIDLYSKADLVKNSSNARPIKTVHFSYSYDLCKGASGDASTGKLTLNAVWFTYNNNNKGKLNPYVFHYHPDEKGVPQNAYNPSYNSKQYDRWGVYKDPSTNPGGLNNTDYSYTLQDSSLSAQYASAWHLTDIQLPSGGRMNITYEADDYAYVQNKRAVQLFTVGGIGAPQKNNLYNSDNNQHEDFLSFYVNTQNTIQSKEEIRDKYLDIDGILYFKLAVNMPEDRWGSGIEMVPGYGKVEDYGISTGNNKQFWVTLAPVEGMSPMSRAALQFLRVNLPSKAYPGSETGDNIDLADAIQMLVSGYSELKNVINGFDHNAKGKNWCNVVDLSRSFVRLSCPNYKKYGGGQRVKDIRIYDNWNKMTGQKESVYGQEYKYTTTETVNGEQVIISSGVASYEPILGGEENPFKKPIDYIEKLAPMAPVNYLFSEEPVGESFFPAPMVGYSKVRVRTLNGKARSANGWEESEYYTSKDYPTIIEHTLLEDGESKIKYETISNILRLNHKSHVTLSQGFRIELNDMNGKIKGQSTYAETDSLHPIRYTLNFYKTDNDRVHNKHLNNKVWVADAGSGLIDTSGQTGKDIEIMVDLREQHSKANTRGFSPNVDVIPFPFLIPFIPIPSFYNFPQSEDTRFRSCAVVKVVQRYGILDSVVVMDKGSVVSTKNILYDAETGNVLVSRTNNEFNDPIYNFSYPAYGAYTGMGMAYKNLGAVFQKKGSATSQTGLELIKGKLYKEGDTAAYPVERFFESGDEIYIDDALLTNTLYPGQDCRHLGKGSLPWQGKLWVMDAQKGLEQNRGMYFIDANGTSLDMYIRHMTIVRSGKKNMPDLTAGGIVSANNPIRLTADGFRIVIDNNTGVLQASAASYKDLWKVENSMYAKDTIYRVLRSFGPITISPQVTTKRFDIDGSGKVREDSWITDSKNIAASFDYIPYRKCVDSRNLYTKSMLNFDFSKIPAGAVINSAWIVLNKRIPRDLWYIKYSGNDNFLCPNTQSFDWSKANNYYSGDAEVYLKRITNSWNYSDPYISILTTDVNRVKLDNVNTNSGVFCTNLVQDMVKNGNYGISFEIIKNSASANKYETNYLNFCAGNESNINKPNCVVVHSPIHSDSINNLASPQPSPIWCDCYAPVLYVSYNAYVDSIGIVCKNYIGDTTNPYRWGILGNWKLEKAYTYFNVRQESDASVTATNIRKEGLLKDFTPFWKFTNQGLTAMPDVTRWVWNSTLSETNRKGAEIENYDPLGRYNSGLFGYNQSLPVAVGQNSRYREILYDGFEDYGYYTSNCISCAPLREIDFTKGGGQLTTAQSHTGLYSIKINSGNESKLTAAVSTNQNDAMPESLSYKINSTQIWVTSVKGKGKGLMGFYTMGQSINVGNTSYCYYGTGVTGTRTDATLNFDWTNSPPMPATTGRCTSTYQVRWTGTLQPKYSENYTLFFRYSGWATIMIGNTVILDAVASNGAEQVTSQISLNAGNLYPILIQINKFYTNPGSLVQLSWGSQSQIKQIIPTESLYPVYPVPRSDTMGSVTKSFYYCIKANSVRSNNVIRPTFSPLQSSKLTVTAWVRADAEDCNAAPLPDNAIQVNFNTGGNASTYSLGKTGARIEGWQRYEANVYVPANASQLYVHLAADKTSNLFFDDIKIQPFNSEVKSYVYNPVNLRLMAELDENNYATFYEYDDDGTLIRVKKETERGIMTVKETRSALLKGQ